MAIKDADWKIDTAGKDSFPASDPPAWGSSHATSRDRAHDNPPRRARRYRTPILLGVLGAVALAGLVVGIRFARSR